MAALERCGLPFEVIEIDHRDADTGQFWAHYGYPHEQTCNTTLVVSRRGPKTFFVGIVPATRYLDVNKAKRRLVGVSKLSFASSEEVLAVTGMEIGGVTPVGLPASVRLFVDKPLEVHKCGR